MYSQMDQIAQETIIMYLNNLEFNYHITIKLEGLRLSNDCITLESNIDVCETLMPPFPNMTFDLDLWPTDLKINRDHLLIKDYLPTKFEASWTKPSWVIGYTRLRATDIPTDRHTDIPTNRQVQRKLPLLFQRGA